MSLLKVNEIQIFNGETVTITAPAVVTANDNTNAALRITQTGTGNALVVEDSANPDSTPFVVDLFGREILGHTETINIPNYAGNNITPARQQLTKTGGASGSTLQAIFINTNYAPSTISAKSRGTSIGDYAAVTNNDKLYVLDAKGADGTGFISAAQIAVEVDGTPGTNDMPGRLVFSTTADGASSPTERMRIDSSGNVGIGTNSPAQKLDVNGNINATGALTLGTALAIAEGGTGATDAATARTNLDVDQAGTDNSTDCTLVTTSHDYLSITGQAITLGPIDLAADVTGTLATSNGGTGVTALSSLDAADLGSGSATDGYVLTADGSGGAAWEAASGVSLPIDLLSSGASIRKSDGTTAVLSESGGAVTLENTSLGDTVLMPDNSNNVSTAPGIRFEADTDTGIGLASAGNLAVVTGGTERMRIDSSGKLLMGKTASGQVLTNGIELNPDNAGYISMCGDSSGNPSLYLANKGTSGTRNLAFFYGTSSLVGSISHNGSSTSYNTSSDYRLKTDVQPMIGATERLKALKPVNFEWIADGTRVDGFLAHEAQEVVPEAVTGTKDAVDADGNPKYQGVDYGRITPLLTAALQEAVSKIEMLEKRIAQLESK